MKRRLLRWLRCPDCHGEDLALASFATDTRPGSTGSPEIQDGMLTCRCDAWFPVIGGVPRLLPRSLRHALAEEYPSYFRQYADRLPSGASQESRDLRRTEIQGQLRTMESFGFEWNEFEDYDEDNFDAWLAPLTPEFFRGKVGLDAGCGAGRHALRAHRYGAEVVAVDLSRAVDAAYRKARMADGVHVVQGDIFNPPLASRSFEFVYSLGVLHHTPDPPGAFQKLVPLLAPGATIAVMVYASGRSLTLGTLALMRAVTTRLPLPVTKSLSWLAAVADTTGPIAVYRALRRLGLTPAVLDRLTPEHVRLYARDTFQTCYTDWLDRLSYPHVHYYSRADLVQWLATAGLHQTMVRPLGRHGWVGIGQAGPGSEMAGSGAPLLQRLEA